MGVNFLVKDIVRMRVIDIRRKNKKTQAEVASVLGYESSKAYYELESGRTSIKIKHLEKLSEYYQVSIAYFFESEYTKMD